MTKSRITPPWFVRRAILVVGVHLIAFLAAYLLAFALRFDFRFDTQEVITFWFTVPGVLMIKALVFYLTGQYRLSWRSVTFSDLASLIKAATLSLLAIFVLYFLIEPTRTLGRAIPLIDWANTILILGGLRAFHRMSREEFRFFYRPSGARKALIVGANQSGHNLARHLYTADPQKYLALGFLDHDLKRLGSLHAGLPVLGRPEEAPKIAVRLNAQEVLVISGTLTGKELRRLMENCAQVGVTLKVIPGMEDLVSGDYAGQIRDVDINDLLRREPVQLSGEAIATLLEGRTLLVTGAGGSIGSEICRQVLRFHPQRLVLVERAENNLFLIEQELRRSKTATELFACIADVTDGPRIDQIFGTHQPAIVFHAAAHKHVPMMESNAGEAIKNNVLGTKQLAELADHHGVQEFVMISTDKAVNPTSVMGASKQIAERFVHAFSEVATTKFVVVRFGNVLASAGSVVPIFQEQIRRGGPITVTHPEIERFFMTIPEASQLVLQAAVMGNGGEIFVLDMGESVRIVDLAQDLIRLSGLEPEDVEIVFTGLRPGEKLYEELYFNDEEMLPTPHPKLFVAYHRPYHMDEVNRLIDALAEVVHEPTEVVCRRLQELVPEYVPPAPEAGAELLAAHSLHSDEEASGESTNGVPLNGPLNGDPAGSPEHRTSESTRP
ncbi:MAG TPA: nucleoside-diphosphate sugar epimerase/dehydratase [Pirellulales bacterium]|nr:nucleoside-diphosphate sugar epimerase/dehydratase [Pirellulales bacterium]